MRLGLFWKEQKGIYARGHATQNMTIRKSQSNDSNTKLENLVLTQVKELFGLLTNEAEWKRP